jgi:hypothetical protein
MENIFGDESGFFAADGMSGAGYDDEIVSWEQVEVFFCESPSLVIALTF